MYEAFLTHLLYSFVVIRQISPCLNLNRQPFPGSRYVYENQTETEAGFWFCVQALIELYGRGLSGDVRSEGDT